MKEELHNILQQHISPHSRIQKVSGGMINDAYYVETDEQPFFVKTNSNVPHSFFRQEAEGLALIRNTNAINVPNVYFYNEPKDDEHGVLILEWVEGDKKKHTESTLGRQLANMHKQHQKKHGFYEDTFIGNLTQPNELYDNWIEYYRNHRIIPQMELAEQLNRMPLNRRDKLNKLLDQLERYIPSQTAPSLLHGDLWGGNWIVGRNGEPYLIDPSVVYGDRLFELAFTELFGGYSGEFYEAYHEAYPIPNYYDDIKPIYQLFYLLVHLNIFGKTYGHGIDRILKKYV
ncbi:fructosamine kinase family protein [Salirhabdus salicampi]|uniref:fructosamine kinase family protein n=1 Tax=Salirhabdus salicampi TaxID=476102 RepID=UPI0020C2E2D4|nr:fructosamine kinase family protein [Salirhabdus salicampi]MCP8617379.1 fructosamine kinase family protein [Salirhabdus salicampi]